jgi:perosamine synthetase
MTINSVGLSNRFYDWKNFLQDSKTLKDLVNRGSYFDVENNSYSLIPFSSMDSTNQERIKTLSEWRNKHQNVYPTKFKVTDARTADWLKINVLQNTKRMMFWVVDDCLNLLGHIGLVLNEDSIFEIDNVLKGPNQVKGLFSNAQKTLEKILHQEFNALKIHLKVLSSNTHAISFYERLDYQLINAIDMKWEHSGDVERLVPGLPSEIQLLTMEKNLVNLTPIPQMILTAGPSISSREQVYVADAVTTGWNLNHSKYIKLFEEKFAETVGSRFAMATSSCTGALHLALLSLGIGPGDEVIVPDITWVATASAVAYVGATPVFADVDSKTWTISVEAIEKVLTRKTKALIPVHLYGFGAQMDEILSFAKAKNLYVVEDAAPAIGTLINGKSAGTFGQFGCYSFQGAKLLVTGEGGMLVSDDENLIKKAWKIQDHGRKPGTFWIEELGYKYKMNNITAAFGLAQLERVEVQIEKKREINSLYKYLLEKNHNLQFQEESPGTKAICWMTSIQLKNSNGNQISLLANYLRENGVDSRPVFPTIHSYPMWISRVENPAARYISENSINLPSGVGLTHAEIEKVANLILKWLSKNERE